MELKLETANHGWS